MIERYWVPTSGPCRFGVVGSWHCPEHLEQVFIADDLGIVLDHHHFGVPGVPLVDHLIVRIPDIAAGITRDSRDHPVQPLEIRLDVPETAGPERRQLVLGLGSDSSSSTCLDLLRTLLFLDFALAAVDALPLAAAGFAGVAFVSTGARCRPAQRPSSLPSALLARGVILSSREPRRIPKRRRVFRSLPGIATTWLASSFYASRPAFQRAPESLWPGQYMGGIASGLTTSFIR